MSRYVFKVYECPTCGAEAKRHSKVRRSITTSSGMKSVELSNHYCPKCNKYFRVPINLAGKRSKYSKAIIRIAVRYNGSLKQIKIHFEQAFGIYVPETTIYDWRKLYSKMRKKVKDDEEI